MIKLHLESIGYVDIEIVSYYDIESTYWQPGESDIVIKVYQAGTDITASLDDADYKRCEDYAWIHRR